MKILVTGAAGFIGQRLCARLAAAGHHICGLSLKTPEHSSVKFEQYYCQNLTKPFSLEDPFDTVVHLAAYNITNIGSKDQGLYTSVNIEGTKHLIEGVKAPRFIFLSTAKVYKHEGLEITEESPLGPQGAYEQSKLKAEELCRDFLKEQQPVILRSVNVIGFGQAPKAVLPVFFQKARANEPLDIMNSGRAMMQFIYVEDLIDAIETAIGRATVSGIFNIANPQAVSLEQLARAVITAVGSRSVLNVAKNDPPVFSPVNCDKAYHQLGWKAKTGLAAILEFYSQAYAAKH